MPSTRLYVGLTKQGARKVFRTAKTPTQASHGDRFMAVIGPFRTVAGANVMAKYGRNNPHLQTVAEAEKMAKRQASDPKNWWR